MGGYPPPSADSVSHGEGYRHSQVIPAWRSTISAASTRRAARRPSRPLVVGKASTMARSCLATSKACSESRVSRGWPTAACTTARRSSIVNSPSSVRIPSVTPRGTAETSVDSGSLLVAVRSVRRIRLQLLCYRCRHLSDGSVPLPNERIEHFRLKMLIRSPFDDDLRRGRSRDVRPEQRSQVDSAEKVERSIHASPLRLLGDLAGY